MRSAWVLVLIGCGRIGFDARTDAGADAGADVTLPANANIAFVTSTTQIPGGFGNLVSADLVCQTRAMAAGMSGTFVAFLSTSAIDARDRIASARGWYRPDGLPIGDTAYALTGGALLHPIRLDELGRDLIDDTTYVATGTFFGIANSTCMDYTSTSEMTLAGYPSFTGGAWMNINTETCGAPMRLYCFQTDYNEPLVITPTPGRRAFVSTTSFDPSTGIAAADALCMEDAMTAGVAGSFRALLPGSVPGPDRFDVEGPPWVRLDGIALAPTARQFLEGRSTAALNMTAQGMYADGVVMTGIATGSAFEPVDSSRTCGPSWTQPGASSQKGWAASTGIPTYVFSTDDCTTLSRVYCLEE